MRQGAVLVAEQPQRVREPGVREHAEVGPERRSLRMLFVVRRERRFEMALRCVELADAQQRAAHRVMRLAPARRIGRRCSASACSETSRVRFKSPSMKRSVNATHSQRTGT